MNIIIAIIIGYIAVILSYFLYIKVFKKTSKTYTSKNKSVSRFYSWFFLIVITFFLVFFLIGQIKRNGLEKDYLEMRQEEDIERIELNCIKDKNDFFKCNYVDITDRRQIELLMNLLYEDAKFNGNHPQTLWRVNVTIHSMDNEIYGYAVEKTNNSGIMTEFFGKNPGDFSGASIMYAGHIDLEKIILETFSNLCEK